MLPSQTNVIQDISPIRVFHDIVSHNLEKEELLVLDENRVIGVSEVKYPNEEINYLPREADLCPQLLQGSRKGKQQAIGVDINVLGCSRRVIIKEKIMKFLNWNIRLVKSQQALHRVQMLHNFYKFCLIGLLEYFQHTRHINKYCRRLK